MGVVSMSRGQKIVPPASKEAENPSTHVQDDHVLHIDQSPFKFTKGQLAASCLELNNYYLQRR